MNKDQLIRALIYAGGDDWSQDTLTMFFLSDKLRELALENFQSQALINSGGASEYLKKAFALIVEDVSTMSLVFQNDLLDAIIEKSGGVTVSEYAMQETRKEAEILEMMDDHLF